MTNLMENPDIQEEIRISEEYIEKLDRYRETKVNDLRTLQEELGKKEVKEAFSEYWDYLKSIEGDNGSE